MPSNPSKREQYTKGWIIVLCSALFYMYQFTLRVSPNIMNHELLSNFALESAGLGILIGAYNWAYSAMQIPLGISMDRVGPRFFLCAAALICAFSCFLFGHTSNPILGGCARFLMGIGSACGFIGTVKIGTLWLHRRHIAKVTGIAILMGTAGASLGGAPLEIILNKIGFQRTMELLGLIGLGITVIVYLFVKNHPDPEGFKKQANATPHNHPLTDVMTLLKTPQAWIMAVYGMLMYLPITVIGVVWGVSFVRTTEGVSDVVAASVVSTMFLGAALGSPVFAYLSDFIHSRRFPMALGSLVTSFIWFIVFLADVPLYMLYVLFFIAGFTYTAKCLSFASICEVMPLNMSGVSIAFVNMVVMSTGILFLPILGALIDWHWDGTMFNGIPMYDASDYSFALLVIPIALIISFILTLFMKETHPDHQATKIHATPVGDDLF